MAEETTSLSQICVFANVGKSLKSIWTIKADVPVFVHTSGTLPSFTFNDINVRSNNETENEGETFPVADLKDNKTKQAVVEAALNAPVEFHHETNEDGYYSI